MKDVQGFEDCYYGTTEEDANQYGETHAKPYHIPFYVTKDGTPSRPWVLMIKMALEES